MNDAPSSTLHILVDADACPVKEEIYKVAWRHEVPVTLVSNQHLRIPAHPLVSKQVVGAGFDGVHVFAPDGQRIGQILLPEICANLCFGGRYRNRLFMCASTSVFSLFVNTQGAVGG